MKKPLPAPGSLSPTSFRVRLKASPDGDQPTSKRAVIDSLIAKHELTELEASWLLEVWELAQVEKNQNRFACYLAGFMAGIALKTVEQEIKSSQS